MSRKQMLEFARRELKKALVQRNRLKRSIRNAHYKPVKARTTRRSKRNLQGRTSSPSTGGGGLEETSITPGQQIQNSGGEGLGASDPDLETGRLGDKLPDSSGIRGSATVFVRGVGVSGPPSKVMGLLNKDGSVTIDVEALTMAQRKAEKDKIRVETKKL